MCARTSPDGLPLTRSDILTAAYACRNRVNLIVHAAGIMDSFAAVSIEKFIMDLEIIEMSRAYLDDIRVDDETLNFDLIREVGPGGLFLTHMDTLKKCRTHGWTPGVALRGSLSGKTPDEKFLENIAGVRDRMLEGYARPETDPAISEAMEDYLLRKGVARETLDRITQ